MRPANQKIPTPTAVGDHIRVRCPGCFRVLDIPSDRPRSRCEYCGTTYRLRVDGTPAFHQTAAIACRAVGDSIGERAHLDALALLEREEGA